MTATECCYAKTILRGWTKKMKKFRIYILQLFACVLAVFILSATGAFAQQESNVDENGLATDITVTLISVAPGYTAYTAHGHCALRLQCPSAGLDISFTYGLDDTPENRMAFFVGNGHGTYSAYHTDDYLKEYASEGRQVYEYELNLSLNEKRHLWELLDSEISGGNFRLYNYLQTNCSSMCVQAINRALDGDQFIYQSLPPVLNGTYRQFVRHISELRPWVNFFWQSLLGSAGEEIGQIEDKLSPELLVEAWQHAVLKDSLGSSRPMIVNEGQLLIQGDDGKKTTWFTPTLFFALLLALAILLTVAEWRGHLRRMGNVVDILLLAGQTLVGLFICYMAFFSILYGASGNWYVIPFNPLPLLLWLLFHRKKGFQRVYLFYTVVLAIFIALTPFVEQIDLPHSLLVAVMAVRCLAKCKNVEIKSVYSGSVNMI